jgi:hypothetical protein
MADLDSALLQTILYTSERQREPEIEHDRQTDDLWTRLEVVVWGALRAKASRVPRCSQAKFL